MIFFEVIMVNKALRKGDIHKLCFVDGKFRCGAHAEKSKDRGSGMYVQTV